VRTPYVLLATIAASLLAAQPALANGRFPASNQIVFSPTNEDIIIGRATYAILPSTDHGKTWGFLCEDVLALPGATNFEDPEIGVTFNNSIVAGLFAPTKGLNVSNDLGCNWNCVSGPLAGQQVADVVVRPDTMPDDSSPGSTSHHVLALVSTLGTTDAGNSSWIYESPDDGATWAALTPGPLDPTVAFATIDVAKSDPNRIYLSGNRGFALGRTASLFVSPDNGAHWHEYALPMFNPTIQCNGEPGMCPSEDTLFIAGVDPTDENIVYLRSNGLTDMMTPGNSVLYMADVTADAGATFQVLKSFALPPPNSDFLNSGEVLGFTLSPDGSTIYAGTKENGLFAASKADPTSFHSVNQMVQVECLADRMLKTGQEELWACSSEKGGFVFGKSTDQGKTFEPMMSTITSLSGLVACSPTATASTACLADANAASVCSCSSYQTFCTTFETSACFGCGQDGPPAADAGGGSSGGSDAGSGGADGGGGGGHSTSSCGCSVVGGGGAAGMLVGCGIMAIALRRRRAR
jgi:hypothetical protein